MRNTFVSMLAVAVVAIAGVAAQGKPNFTGKWTYVPGSGPALFHHPVATVGERPDGGRNFFFFNEPGAPGPDFIGGNQVEITQDAATLKVQYLGPARYTLTYALDGSVNRNTPPPAADSVVTSIVAWEGNTLVINSEQTIKTPQGPSLLYLKQTLSIAADGTLVVETRRGTGTTRAVYKKN